MTPEQIAALMSEDFDEYEDLDDEDQFEQSPYEVTIDPIVDSVYSLLPPEIVQDRRFRPNLDQIISLASGQGIDDPNDIADEIIGYYQNSR